MLFRPVFYSCTNKATHFKELAKTTSFSFFLKDRKNHEYRFIERYNKKTQEAAFPTGLGEIPLWDGQTWPQTQHGEVLNSPGQLLQLWLIRSVSEGWVTTGQAQRAQTKNLQAFHKGSGHNKSKTEKNSIIFSIYTTLRERVFFRRNMLGAINTSQGYRCQPQSWKRFFLDTQLLLNTCMPQGQNRKLFRS